jgi:hypothetical protein
MESWDAEHPNPLGVTGAERLAHDPDDLYHTPEGQRLRRSYSAWKGHRTRRYQEAFAGISRERSTPKVALRRPSRAPGPVCRTARAGVARPREHRAPTRRSTSRGDPDRESDPPPIVPPAGRSR